MKALTSEERELRWVDRNLRSTTQRRLLLDREGKRRGSLLRGGRKRFERENLREGPETKRKRKKVS